MLPAVCCAAGGVLCCRVPEGLGRVGAPSSSRAGQSREGSAGRSSLAGARPPAAPLVAGVHILVFGPSRGGGSAPSIIVTVCSNSVLIGRCTHTLLLRQRTIHQIVTVCSNSVLIGRCTHTLLLRQRTIHQDASSPRCTAASGETARSSNSLCSPANAPCPLSCPPLRRRGHRPASARRGHAWVPPAYPVREAHAASRAA